MNSATVDSLESLIRNAGEDWLIDWYAPREGALSHFREILSRADDAARERLVGDLKLRNTQKRLT